MLLFTWLVGDKTRPLGGRRQPSAALPHDLVWEHRFCSNVIIPFSWGFHPCVILQSCMWRQRKDPRGVALPIS